MKNIMRILITTIAFLFLYTGCGTQSFQPQNSICDSKKYDLVFQGQLNPPEYEAESNGAIVNSLIYKNKVAVITIGATWCSDCQKEFAILNKLYKKYKNNPDIVFLTTISVDGKKQTKESAQEYFSKSNLELPYYFADSKELKRKYKINFIPTTFIINKKGESVQIGLDSNGDPKYYFIEKISENELDKVISDNLVGN